MHTFLSMLESFPIYLLAELQNLQCFMFLICFNSALCSWQMESLCANQKNSHMNKKLKEMKW